MEILLLRYKWPALKIKSKVGKCFKTFVVCDLRICAKLVFVKTKLEKLARDKHSSLLRKFVIYGHKSFYNIVRRAIWALKQIRFT
jgi:hypothetical protein